ncbi:MAG TPA: NUDIX hydrolase [Acidimicrobiales bacterium]|nr:NUDIX hydrolase [Acidimicrobiales bacterium]
MSTPGTTVVQAAGGVVWRRSPAGELEVLLVHRPKYDDWTVPKGKLDPGEGHAEAALREVEEETGLRCTLGPELGSTSYRDRKGRPKQARYWAMTPVAGRFTPTDEVDRAAWLPVDEAKAVLTYERDRPVLDALRATV